MRIGGSRTKKAADQGRHVQAVVDRIDKKGRPPEPKNPMQAGEREYPSKFPEQHLKKSGSEGKLALAPMYDAPYYKGSDKLQDMVALITGGDSGIGRAVAVLFAARVPMSRSPISTNATTPRRRERRSNKRPELHPDPAT